MRHYQFTMVELLTIIIMICLLTGLLLPALSGSINRAKLAACGNNLRQIGQSVQLYCADNNGMIPNILRGMEENSIPVLRLPGNMVLALGRLMDFYVDNAHIFGCPGSPGYQEADVEKLWQGNTMVWTAYLYRGQNNNFSGKLNSPENFNKAYIMDFACITNQGEQFAPHNYLAVNILYNDCHIENRPNNKTPFRYYTAQAARHGEITPDCTKLWQHADNRK
ncbi:MAG: hypothetical protein IKA65_02365 [Lentisphaeria bacterium]|nr:hypothetical protein [Lentisphaeria bacterium]